MKHYLLSPGPTAVPPEVLAEISRPVMHHRTEAFYAVFREVQKGLKLLFGTEETVLTLVSSGTGAMEAAFVNLLSPEDTVLVVDAGKFGARWAEIASAYGVSAEILKYEWGYAARVEDIQAALEKNPAIKAVFMQGSETSTAVYHPVREIAAFIKSRPDTILVVDGITSVGVYETHMDEWGIDVLLTGSQKALMLPPGLGFVALSAKAQSAMEKSRLPKYYFNLKNELKNQVKNTTAWTSGVNLVYGLAKSLELMQQEGLDNMYRRHRVCADATRAACAALGLELVAKQSPSDAVTGFYLPAGVDGMAFSAYLESKLGVTVAGGQDHLKGKIIRISHMGYHNIFDTLIAIAAIEAALREFGVRFAKGAGVAAVSEYVGI